MNFSDHGVPILGMQGKLAALSHCLAEGAYEDAAGHLSDLLEYCRTRIEPSWRPQFRDLPEMVTHYGAHPCPIEE